jgi:hypothetical protein
MAGLRKKRLAFLAATFLIVLAGTVLLLSDIYKVREPVLVFGVLNLGVVLLAIGGLMSYLTPKIWPPRNKR